MLRIFGWLALAWLLCSCVTLLDATNDTPIEPDPGKRSFGAYVDDERLETIIAVNLKKQNAGLESAHINVKVFNAVVLLSGEVASRELKELASETVRGLSKVRQVHNELQVQPNSTMSMRTADNWIATKVRSQMIADRAIQAERVKVIVEGRVVYLMGLLTRAEADMVSELAASVRGVAKVVRVIEYIDEP